MPIRKHLKEGWSPEAPTAIKQLKEECQQFPKLQPPRDGLLILQTDASLDFWAAVLFERREKGEERLCAYTSGEFSPSEKNYFIEEK